MIIVILPSQSATFSNLCRHITRCRSDRELESEGKGVRRQVVEEQVAAEAEVEVLRLSSLALTRIQLNLLLHCHLHWLGTCLRHLHSLGRLGQAGRSIWLKSGK